MADNLIFPVKFDLEAAVKAAQGDADRLLRRLQTTINAKPLAANLRIDGAGSGSINEINSRLRDLVKQWNSLTEAERISNKTSGEFTPQAKKIIAEYTRLTGATESYARTLGQIAAAARRAANEQEKNMEKQRKTNAILQAQENTIDNITAKLKHWRSVLNSSELNGQQFRKAADEVRRLSKELETAKSKVDAMTGKAKSVNTLTQEFAKQDGYVSRLVKRLAVYASFSAFQTLLTSIREVTAEFELQRVSLGAIIQDQTKANQLFSEIKAFALKSPLKILDLTKYTKQVAAYRIETDKLFDTTKRLADVSVGLGVDMGRLVLAYGQVKAASYLRAAEIRQFTEAGIPMLELLAEKFTKLQGSAVSTEEVMDKVSKRMVSFGMVEEIFKDMTDAGGMFYNMQEKQSQTLYGMWAKMGDAAAVMYEQMGNTATANQGMKDAIQLLSDMMLHWTALANVAQTAAIGFLGYKAAIAGLVPFYALQTKLTVNQIKAEKAKQAQQIKTLAVGRALTREEQLAVMSKNKLMAADYKRLLTEGKLSAAQKLSLGRQAASNVQLRRAVIELNLFTKAQITALSKMSGWQFFWAKFKLWGQGIGQMFVNLGRTMKAFAPMIALTAVFEMLTEWRETWLAQSDAVKKVDKQYEETKVTLMQIENAYRDIQNASKAAGESEEEFAKTSYSQKLEQLQKVIKLLGQFGMKNVIDPSVLDYTNIDPVLDKWLGKLNEVNELARGWGREVALVANAYEGNVMGWSVFGENLKEDMKDLERAWTKLTVNSEFSASLEQLRAIVGKLSNDNKQVYENISRAIGADLKLALGQKRRNESELQYQQRIYKNYQDIYSWIQTKMGVSAAKILPRLEAGDVQSMLNDFQGEVDEVMHEFDKVKEKFRGQDALTVKMAIDTVAAENDWTEWQKELLIQHLNEDPITLNAEIIPVSNEAGAGAIYEGLKAIITSEFPTLFNENELQSLVSAEGIVEAIDAKLNSASEKLAKLYRIQNNVEAKSEGQRKTLAKMQSLQNEITQAEKDRAELLDLQAKSGQLTSEELIRKSELEAKLQDMDETALNAKRKQIAAYAEMNQKTDEYLQKQREQLENEIALAQAAKERVTAYAFSDTAKDFKEQFGGTLMYKPDEHIGDDNYNTKFKITDEDLEKVKDLVDLEDLWRKKRKEATEYLERIRKLGISEATVEKERVALEKKKADARREILRIEQQIKKEKLLEDVLEYNALVRQLNAEKNQGKRAEIQAQMNALLAKGNITKYQQLQLEKQSLKAEIAKALASQKLNEQQRADLKAAQEALDELDKVQTRYNFSLAESGRSRGGRGEDPWILLMKNRMKFMQDFQKGVEDLSKWMGYTKGLADEQENMLGRGLSLKIDSRKLDGTKEELIKWYEDSINEIRKRIAKLGGKEWEGLGVQMILAKDTKSRVLKKYQELLADMFKELTDFRTDQTQKALEAKIKELVDRISRTKTAKEFYEKILGMTGDYSLASKVAESIFGQNGAALQKALADQVRGMTNGIELPDGIISADNIINYKALRQFAEANKEELGKMYDELIKISNDGQKDLAKTYEGYLKDLEKAKTYADKRVELARTTAAKIREIERNPQLSKEQKAELKRGYQEREDREAAKLEYEAFKDTPLYVQMFEDLEHASTSTLEMMKSRLEALSGIWGTALDPTQLKEIQSRMNEIDSQLRERNPFKTLKKSYQQYRDAVKDYTIQGAEANVATAKAAYDKAVKDTGSEDSKEARAAKKTLDIEKQRLEIAQKLKNEKGKQLKGQKAIDKAAQIANDREAQARVDLAEALAKEEKVKAEGGDLEAAHAEVEAKKEALNLAQATSEVIQKDAKTSKTLKENFASAANQVTQYMGMAGDLAHAVADTMEALGGDEDDVQFWNDIGDAIGDLTAGFQGLIDSILSLNVAGVISNAIGVIPNMVKGFVGLFSAGKVRRANKEIKRQQQLLEQLEYTYGRLEKAADKAFGRDYINNYESQLKNLQAQYTAYLKQAEAERSKGKKKDKEKIKEYENQARDTADKIKELRDDLVAHFTGSTKTDVARQMAQSWVDARASMSDTFAAIKSNYQDMIKSMIVEGAAARVIENALTPMWDKMQKRLEVNDVDGAIDEMVKGMDAALGAANEGMEVLWKAMEARGYDMRKLLGETDGATSTGISKSREAATSEEVLANTAALNTQNYYMSHIDEHVAAIRALMERGTATVSASTATAGWTDWQQQAMDNYQAIARNTADTVVRCERAAIACETVAKNLSRVTSTKGNTQCINVAIK